MDAERAVAPEARIPRSAATGAVIFAEKLHAHLEADHADTHATLMQLTSSVEALHTAAENVLDSFDRTSYDELVAAIRNPLAPWNAPADGDTYPHDVPPRVSDEDRICDLIIADYGHLTATQHHIGSRGSIGIERVWKSRMAKELDTRGYATLADVPRHELLTFAAFNARDRSE